MDQDNPNYYPFRPGMSATVDIQTKTVYNVLGAPIQSVTVRPDSTKVSETNKMKKGEDEEFTEEDEEEEEEMDMSDMIEVVFVLEDGVAKMHYVKPGIQDNNYIQINGMILNDTYHTVSDAIKIQFVSQDKNKFFFAMP